ncbi:GNAT family N-acetyltransferase [Jeotgalibacillus salarius]|uniref:GNAT family N-acetyltransferase n=1 Tax=Jeotgalibacillus salarius TaxID=546023 RepID=A0A4Y8LL56_9BACL|nr:GNAT family N-acetyltransferase [Jeotgalibacillus salarius]TFE03129.1 GNAT family N-acetyltransferase [Jeotgalibacillus salarius]
MLIRYKKSFEKIAMGLMSFMPTEKDIKQLQQSMKQYEEERNFQLFLWKEEDLIGLTGVEIEEHKIILRHISVNPSHRNEGVGHRIVAALKEMYSDKELVSTSYTEGFLQKCKDSETAAE